MLIIVGTSGRSVTRKALDRREHPFRREKRNDGVDAAGDGKAHDRPDVGKMEHPGRMPADALR
jgi:hypothetical protein